MDKNDTGIISDALPKNSSEEKDIDGEMRDDDDCNEHPADSHPYEDNEGIDDVIKDLQMNPILSDTLFTFGCNDMMSPKNESMFDKFVDHFADFVPVFLSMMVHGSDYAKGMKNLPIKGDHGRMLDVPISKEKKRFTMLALENIGKFAGRKNAMWLNQTSVKRIPERACLALDMDDFDVRRDNCSGIDSKFGNQVNFKVVSPSDTQKKMFNVSFLEIPRSGNQKKIDDYFSHMSNCGSSWGKVFQFKQGLFAYFQLSFMLKLKEFTCHLTEETISSLMTYSSVNEMVVKMQINHGCRLGVLLEKIQLQWSSIENIDQSKVIIVMLRSMANLVNGMNVMNVSLNSNQFNLNAMRFDTMYYGFKYSSKEPAISLDWNDLSIDDNYKIIPANYESIVNLPDQKPSKNKSSYVFAEEQSSAVLQYFYILASFEKKIREVFGEDNWPSSVYETASDFSIKTINSISYNRFKLLPDNIKTSGYVVPPLDWMKKKKKKGDGTESPKYKNIEEAGCNCKIFLNITGFKKSKSSKMNLVIDTKAKIDKDNDEYTDVSSPDVEIYTVPDGDVTPIENVDKKKKRKKKGKKKKRKKKKKKKKKVHFSLSDDE